jgi:hypothetical protein
MSGLRESDIWDFSQEKPKTPCGDERLIGLTDNCNVVRPDGKFVGTA